MTVADRRREELLRERIAERFPQDGILGEEFGSVAGSSGFQWMLDPIDGTKSFIHGVPLYTTLVAVLRGRGFVSGRHSCARDGRNGLCSSWPQSCGTSAAEANRRDAGSGLESRSTGRRVCCSRAKLCRLRGRSPNALEMYLQLQATARLARTWGDGYGYMMVATGRAEVMIDPVMNLWDVASLKPIIEEAGGTFTDWKGQATIHSGEAIASNGLVTGEVMAIVLPQSMINVLGNGRCFRPPFGGIF